MGGWYTSEMPGFGLPPCPLVALDTRYFVLSTNKYAFGRRSSTHGNIEFIYLDGWIFNDFLCTRDNSVKSRALSGDLLEDSEIWLYYWERRDSFDHPPSFLRFEAFGTYNCETKKSSTKALIRTNDFPYDAQWGVIYKDYYLKGPAISVHTHPYITSILGAPIRYYGIGLPNTVTAWGSLDLTHLESLVISGSHFRFAYIYITLSVLIGIHTLVLFTESLKPIGAYHIVTEDDILEFPGGVGAYSYIPDVDDGMSVFDTRSKYAPNMDGPYKTVIIRMPVFRAYGIGDYMSYSPCNKPYYFWNTPVIHIDGYLADKFIYTS